MKTILVIHPVISGESEGPTVWGLSVRQTLVFGASVGVGFVGFSLLKKAGLESLTSLVVASALPLSVFLFFVALVVRKPASYARCWRAWVWMRFSQKALFEIPTSGGRYDESE